MISLLTLIITNLKAILIIFYWLIITLIVYENPLIYIEKNIKEYLRDHLNFQDKSINVLEWSARQKITVGAACGLTYQNS